MKYQTITIEGKERPIRFSVAALYLYEQDTGRNAIADFTNVSGNGSISVTVATDLVYAGLVAGHKAAKVDIDFDKMDVAEWAFAKDGVLTQAMKLFEAAFAPAESDDGAKKKTGAG